MKQPQTAQTAQLLQQIARIQHMEPGKLCVLRQGPNGPYYNLQWREQGKALSRYVPADQVEVLAQHTANYQTLPEPGRPIRPAHYRADPRRASRRL